MFYKYSKFGWDDSKMIVVSSLETVNKDLKNYSTNYGQPFMQRLTTRLISSIMI